MKIKAYLYDASGKNEEVEFGEEVCRRLNDKQLLWVVVLERNKETIEHVNSIVGFDDAPIDRLVNEFERPNLDKYENFYRFFINSVDIGESGTIIRVPIDFLVGKNIVLTVHGGDVRYFDEFRNLDEGETHIGELDAESFIASLLDLHIVSYFRVIEAIEHKVDRFDDRILTRDMKDEEFLSEMLKLRRDVSKVRRWLLPHREVFHTLTRPDFQRIAESDSSGHFQKLMQNFEGLIDTTETARDAVLSLFDLYTTRASHKMNFLMKRLTFATIIFGALSVIVGAFGMNFDVGFFKVGQGFWLTVIAMGILAAALLAIAKIKDWI